MSQKVLSSGLPTGQLGIPKPESELEQVDALEEKVAQLETRLQK